MRGSLEFMFISVTCAVSEYVSLRTAATEKRLLAPHALTARGSGHSLRLLRLVYAASEEYRL